MRQAELVPANHAAVLGNLLGDGEQLVACRGEIEEGHRAFGSESKRVHAVGDHMIMHHVATQVHRHCFAHPTLRFYQLGFVYY